MTNKRAAPLTMVQKPKSSYRRKKGIYLKTADNSSMYEGSLIEETSPVNLLVLQSSGPEIFESNYCAHAGTLGLTQTQKSVLSQMVVDQRAVK